MRHREGHAQPACLGAKASARSVGGIVLHLIDVSMTGCGAARRHCCPCPRRLPELRHRQRAQQPGCLFADAGTPQRGRSRVRRWVKMSCMVKRSSALPNSRPQPQGSAATDAVCSSWRRDDRAAPPRTRLYHDQNGDKPIGPLIPLVSDRRKPSLVSSNGSITSEALRCPHQRQERGRAARRRFSVPAHRRRERSEH